MRQHVTSTSRALCWQPLDRVPLSAAAAASTAAQQRAPPVAVGVAGVIAQSELHRHPPCAMVSVSRLRAPGQLATRHVGVTKHLM